MIRHRDTRTIVIHIVIALTLSACAIQPWTQIEKDKRIAGNSLFKVTLPVGWMQANYLNDVYYVRREKTSVPIRVNRITLTRDGFGLEDIDFIRFDAKDAFPNLQKTYTNNMLPSEAADLLIADLKKSGLEALTVHNNAPATIAGKRGFRLLISYNNARGLRSERLIYGFGHKAGFFIMSYEAPSLHYFPRYKSAFDDVLRSFRLTG